MTRYTNFLIAVSISLIACNESTSTPPSETKDDTSIHTVAKEEAKKPAFPGYSSKSYILGDSSYIRVVSNLNYRVRAWMVYYDRADQRWSRLNWQDTSDAKKDNRLIGDSVFTRAVGLKGGHSSDDAPEFYAAVSRDSGRTWQALEFHETYYDCKNSERKGRSFLTSVLVSNDYMNETKRPSIAIIIQNKQQGSFSTGSIEQRFDFSFLCPVTRNFE